MGKEGTHAERWWGNLLENLKGRKDGGRLKLKRVVGK
jgi:hypothetical protein